jgi:hypothetical protein
VGYFSSLFNVDFVGYHAAIFEAKLKLHSSVNDAPFRIGRTPKVAIYILEINVKRNGWFNISNYVVVSISFL